MLTLIYNGTPYVLQPKGLQALMRLEKLRVDMAEHDKDTDGKALDILILAVLAKLAEENGWVFDPKREELRCTDCGLTAADHGPDGE